MSQTLEGRVTAAQRLHDPYLELPFDVPEGAAAIELSYRHDAGSVLDLGLFDPDVGAFPSLQGFRGWSGGARSRVMVTADRATPGYLPGPLKPGRWRVVLGLAAVAPGGCNYRVEVCVHSSTPAAVPGLHDRHDEPLVKEAGAEHDRSAAAGPRWYPADLQSHSHHSDARGSLLDLRAAALARQLEVLSVTDHNTVSHHQPMTALACPELLWLPGTELTTYRGHANVWGVQGWVDFRVRSQADLETLVEHVHERGGLFSVNHPKRSPGCIGCDWEYRVPANIDCLEAWQGPWWLRNWESLERYDELLREGRRLTLVGGSDRHQPEGPDRDPEEVRLGSPTTWLWLEERSGAAVVEALRAGRASVSEQPSGPFLEVEVLPAEPDAPGSRPKSVPGAAVRGGDELRATVLGAVGERLRWIGAGGVLRERRVDAERFEDTWRPTRVGPFVRAEVVAEASLAARKARLVELAKGRDLPLGVKVEEPFGEPYRLALANPVYFEDRAGGALTAERP